MANWDRIEQGALYAATSRLDWISLLRRTFDVDSASAADAADRCPFGR